MAIQIVTEDGTGLPNATTYCSIAESNQFFENTGRKAQWTAYTNNERAGALNHAARYMDDTYAHRYLGDIQASTRDTQALLWPRENVPNPRAPAEDLPASPVPPNIHRANAEFALAFLEGGDLRLYGQDDAATPDVLEKEVEVVGAVRKRERFSGGGRASRRRRFPLAEAALAPYITQAQQRVVRA